jgi:hypothetical protein
MVLSLFGLCLSSSILKNTNEHNVPETDPVSEKLRSSEYRTNNPEWFRVFFSNDSKLSN